MDVEVVFKDDDQEGEDEPEMDVPVPPTPITHRDMDIIIRGWEEKFLKMMECLREVQTTAERANSDMCLMSQEARAQSQEHDRRLVDFMRNVEKKNIPTTPHVYALRASTPRMCPEFNYDASPVERDEASHPRPSTLPHFESARTEEDRETRNTLPHAQSARTEDLDSMETHMGSALRECAHRG